MYMQLKFIDIKNLLSSEVITMHTPNRSEKVICMFSIFWTI